VKGRPPDDHGGHRSTVAMLTDPQTWRDLAHAGVRFGDRPIGFDPW
jgi:hypothetical protein